MAFSLTRHASLLGIDSSQQSHCDYVNITSERNGSNLDERNGRPNIPNSNNITGDEPITDGGAFLSVEVTHISRNQVTTELSTSAVLHYCKKKVLSPYFRLLAFLGWRPLHDFNHDATFFTKFFNISYALTIVVFIIVGYLLQYAACFRRDGYQCYQNHIEPLPVTLPPYLLLKEEKTNKVLSRHESFVPSQLIIRECEGNVIFLYLIPNFLHFAAYVYSLITIRNSENDQLQTILERVFLQSTTPQGFRVTQRPILRRLRLFLLLGLLWLLSSMILQILHIMSEEIINFTWIKTESNTFKVALIVIMLIGLFWFDLICVAVVLTYGVHCQLVSSYITSMCDRVRECNLGLQEFIKLIEELRKILRYVNNNLATGMSLLLIIFACNTSTGLYNLFGGKISQEKSVIKMISSTGALLLWLSIFSFPIIMAVRLSSSLNLIRKLAQELRSRPFGYTLTSLHELDSFLLYASSLSLKARIYRLPVSYAFVLAFVTASFYLLVFLGQVSVVKFST